MTSWLSGMPSNMTRTALPQTSKSANPAKGPLPGSKGVVGNANLRNPLRGGEVQVEALPQMLDFAAKICFSEISAIFVNESVDIIPNQPKLKESRQGRGRGNARR